MLSEELVSTKDDFVRILACLLTVLVACMWLVNSRTEVSVVAIHINSDQESEGWPISTDPLKEMSYQEAQAILNNFCLKNTGRVCDEVIHSQVLREELIFNIQMYGFLPKKPLVCVPAYGRSQYAQKKSKHYTT